MSPSATTLLAVLASGPAGDAIELRWDAPPSCPDQAQVRDEVDTLLGGPARPAERWVVDARVEQLGDAYTLSLTMQTASGTDARSITAPECSQLARATALIV
ncbi:MAG: hypothetical protein AAF721_39365, partial [Myxococcota bacterium]